MGGSKCSFCVNRTSDDENENSIAKKQDIVRNEKFKDAIYTGEIIRGAKKKRHGIGIMRWPDGTVYEGNWKSD